MAIWDKLFKNEAVETIPTVLEAKIGKSLENDVSPDENSAMQRLKDYLDGHTGGCDCSVQTANGKSYIKFRFCGGAAWYLAFHDNCSYISAVCSPYVTFPKKMRSTFVTHAERLNQVYGYDLFHVGMDEMFLLILKKVDQTTPDFDSICEDILGEIALNHNETYAALHNGKGRLAELIQTVQG